MISQELTDIATAHSEKLRLAAEAIDVSLYVTCIYRSEEDCYIITNDNLLNAARAIVEEHKRQEAGGEPNQTVSIN